MQPERARQLLEAERERLQTILESEQLEGETGQAEQETASEVLSYSASPSDAPQQLYEREQEQSFTGHAEAELAEVEHALQRVADGTYGTCEECGRPIPDERLEARPATRHDVEHQRADERRAGVSGDVNERAAGDPTATSGQGRTAR